MAAPASQIRLPLFLALTLALGMFIGQQLPRTDNHISRYSSGNTANGDVLDEIMQYVNARYVDTINVSQVREKAIRTVLDQLDPHSVYITPEEAKAVEDDMSGGFDGIGVEYLMLDDTIQVVSPIAGGPSEAAGIIAGDKIVSIDDSIVAGVKIDNGQIYKKLRGNKGTPVKLGIRRGQEAALRDITVLRDRIPVNSVDAAYMLDEHTGYVKVSRFTSKTYTEFMTAVRPMAEEQEMTNLVLDLRGNPGGYLEEATQMLSQFFPDGKLLVYTEGRNDARQEYKSNGHARFNIQNIAVLIDEGSASASEIVAGALQDHDRGWIIGRRSYGKGLVQEEYPLSNKGRLRLTVSRYYTPSGRCIQRPYKGNKDYSKEEENRLKTGELSDISKAKLNDTTPYYTGMGRIVYGGGGITPDVFIPLDTTWFRPWFSAVAGYIPQFVSRWMEQNERSKLPANAEQMIAFQPSDALVEDFITYTEKQGVNRNNTQIMRAKNEIKQRLKARIARVLFKEEMEFRIINSDDPAVEKAIQLLKTGEPLKK